jgi:hypothetical protein
MNVTPIIFNIIAAHLGFDAFDLLRMLDKTTNDEMNLWNGLIHKHVFYLALNPSQRTLCCLATTLESNSSDSTIITTNLFDYVKHVSH